MENLMYMMMIEKTKTYNKMTKSVVTEHVENIRRLDDAGKLEICGVFKGYPGMAGMYILKTQSCEEAEEICSREPLVAGGYATYKLVTLEIANRENNYLL
ncbi:YciI family protein [Bacteroides caecimuris]|uniref:YciI family protein n=1 Tax=Bacteroides caecimuris TaxID=1796613 RepID=UPI003467DF09